MKRALVWKRLDVPGAEYAEIDLDTLLLEGDIVLFDGVTPWSVSYRVQCDTALTTKTAFVRVKRDGERDERTISRGSSGEWTVNGVGIPGFKGLSDVDLSITPSTNTVPLRRLQLRPGSDAEVTAVWVKFPELDLLPLRQIYRRVKGNRYEYEVPDLAFRTTLECDDHGIVQVYHGLWEAC